ncbi:MULTISPECIES: 5'-nucleotidase C-terminal domain-containing protein [unclassified Kaistella]|uniref:5'-nucleotidase C-terminal domain-containing protein n=1 Tax=unclassified Kaistella TaxID=2762626 RepID=UPI0027364A64|nr:MULTISPECIES: 5'-nucleotidase [unclassified Kaistella]MDP2453633.1 5'-nucleotidase [Kaistella sp. SH11-4b]MDP2456690.1 5'-nucleotidase [Kaistella sp. SH40-3]MDP2459446.1 5'-nucleotidase [Kaistella sp. SH19-2b]
MKTKYLISGLALLSILSCRTPLNIASVQAEKNISISKDLPEDENFKNIIEPYKIELDGKMNTKISHTSVDLTKQGDDSNLGNLLADFTFEGADDWAKANGIENGVDGAVINIGGIRTTIGAGDILTKQIYEVMPFENEVIIMKMKGSDLQGLFDYYLKTLKNNPVSHIVIETDTDKITNQLINGKPIDVNKTYYIATSDYLALGGDNMDYFKKGEMISTGIKLRDLFLEKFKENPEIKVPTDLRLNFKNKKNKTDE